MFRKLYPVGVFMMVALPLSACSTDSFNEMVGLAKTPPDESQVTTSRPLAVPPDYALKPPLESSRKAEVSSAPSPTPATAPATRTASIQTPAPSPMPEGTGQGTTAQPADTVAGEISKTNPDGTPKTAKQIREEARQIQIARERAKNPNYGTWRNLLGALWD